MANDQELQYKWETKRFKVKTLSPLHIGASEPWQKDFDYIYHTKSRTVFFIDYDDFLSKFDTGFLRETDGLKEFKETLFTYFDQHKLKVLRKYSLSNEVSYIYPFVGSGDSPLIPGSSIKGALRTAVISAVTRKKIEQGQPLSINPGDFLEKQVGRNRDNIKQSMNAVQVQDLPFDSENLSLFQFRSYSLRKLEFVEKPDKTRVVEAIPANTPLKNKLVLRMSYREQDRQLFQGTEEILDIATTLKNHYLQWLPREIAFLKKYPSADIQPVIQFYETLVEKLENGVLLLHMGFGTGWEGKTGTFLENNRYMWEKSILEYLKETRRESEKSSHPFTKLLKDYRYLKCPGGHIGVDVSRFDAFKVFCPQCRKDYNIEDLEVIYPFPKSRKFVFSIRSLLPPGWLELEHE
jgi:CRISPR/Cas system CSM-associated protein Csm5 (group 7 of RAMP superfamily)